MEIFTQPEKSICNEATANGIHTLHHHQHRYWYKRPNEASVGENVCVVSMFQREAHFMNMNQRQNAILLVFN